MTDFTVTIGSEDDGKYIEIGSKSTASVSEDLKEIQISEPGNFAIIEQPFPGDERIYFYGVINASSTASTTFRIQWHLTGQGIATGAAISDLTQIAVYRAFTSAFSSEFK